MFWALPLYEIKQYSDQETCTVQMLHASTHERSHILPVVVTLGLEVSGSHDTPLFQALVRTPARGRTGAHYEL